MQIIQKKSSKTLSILKSFQGSGTLFYKLFVFYIINSNISCFCFFAAIMACKHTALYANPASCFCLCFNRLCIIYSVKTVLKYKFFQRCILYRKSKLIMCYVLFYVHLVSEPYCLICICKIRIFKSCCLFSFFVCICRIAVKIL